MIITYPNLPFRAVLILIIALSYLLLLFMHRMYSNYLFTFFSLYGILGAENNGENTMVLGAKYLLTPKSQNT